MNEFRRNRADCASTQNWIQLLGANEIDQHVQKCADHMNSKFTQRDNVVLVCVLNGAIHFYSDLIRKLTFPFKTEFVNISSYDGQSQVDVSIRDRNVFKRLKGSTVVLIDELYDTGKTFKTLIEIIVPYGVMGIYKYALFTKSGNKACYAGIFFGLEVPDIWLVGYGLDDQGFKRGWNGLFGCPKTNPLLESNDDKIFDNLERIHFYLDTKTYGNITYESLQWRLNRE
jgi:hypoxanthine phosphoribosyltransferase